MDFTLSERANADEILDRSSKAMPLYFFHLYNHIKCTDDEGTQLPDLEAVRAHAIRSARDTMSHDVKSGEVCLSHRIEVTDRSNQLVLTQRFGDAVTILP